MHFYHFVKEIRRLLDLRKFSFAIKKLNCPVSISPHIERLFGWRSSHIPVLNLNINAYLVVGGLQIDGFPKVHCSRFFTSNVLQNFLTWANKNLFEIEVVAFVPFEWFCLELSTFCRLLIIHVDDDFGLGSLAQATFSEGSGNFCLLG